MDPACSATERGWRKPIHLGLAVIKKLSERGSSIPTGSQALCLSNMPFELVSLVEDSIELFGRFLVHLLAVSIDFSQGHQESTGANWGSLVGLSYSFGIKPVQWPLA